MVPPLHRSKSYLKNPGDTLKVLHTLHKTLVVPLPYNIKKKNGEFELRVIENKTLFYFMYSLIGIASVTAGIITQTINKLEYTEAQINVVTTNIFLISIWINKQKIVKNLRKLAKLDYKFNKLGFKIQYKFYIYLVWVILAIDILLQIILRWAFLNYKLDNYLQNVIHTLIGLSTSFYFYYIIVCLLLINNILKNLNKFLKHIFHTAPEKMRNKNIRIAQKYYKKLRKIAKNFNITFNIPIVIICGICFINSVSALNEWWQQSTPAIEMFQWIIIHPLKILILSIVCDNTKNEVKILIFFIFTNFIIPKIIYGLGQKNNCILAGSVRKHYK